MNSSMQSIRTLSVVSLLAGLWLAISPYFLDYSGLGSAMTNSVIIGIVVAVLAIVRFNEDQMTWPSWLNALLGVWMILAPAVIGFSYSSTAGLNSLILGIVILVVEGWDASLNPNQQM